MVAMDQAAKAAQVKAMALTPYWAGMPALVKVR
jgi:hypothetical protein